MIVLREKFLEPRRVICTGNPNRAGTLAQGIKKIFPDAEFLHLSNGWDLTDRSDHAQQKLIEKFKKYNTFINASYVAPFVQSFLLEVCRSSSEYYDVFNIGSTHEYDGLNNGRYHDSKLDLRNNSLKLNSYRFRTHHIILGGIKNPLKPETSEWLDIDEICAIVPWILEQNFCVPMMVLDQHKQPW